MLPVAPERAAQLVLERREARRSMVAWCKLCGFDAAAHHRLLIARLEAICRGEIRRLAIFMPPGSAKSTYASVLFPPYYLQHHRTASLIAASHTDQLAERWGRRIRALIDEHSQTLGLELQPGDAASGRWSLKSGAEYFAAGVGGAIAGRRGDLVIIDDPIRSREDADSELQRQKVSDWWDFDVFPRLKPQAAVILIMTRWHEDDLAGRFLARDASAWETISLPMEAEEQDPLGRAPGERLWPEWFDDAMVKEAKRDPRVWSALYQQRPVPEGGAYFERPWLRDIDTPPPITDLNVYGASDYAVTSRGGDFTVHVVVGVDSDENLYVLDLWRKQTASDEWIEAWCDLIESWRPLYWAEEAGQINASLGPYMLARQRERRTYCARRTFPSRHDKAVRAQGIRARMATLGLNIPKQAAWRADLISELLKFPAGRHDDQVDALGLIGQLLDHIRGQGRPYDPERRRKVGYSPYRSENPRPLAAYEI